MNIRYALAGDNTGITNTLQGYYWNKDDEEWLETISIFEEDHIVLQTRHTSTVGIFDTAILDTVAVEEPQEEEVEQVDEEADDVDPLKIAGITVVILLLIAVPLVLRKRSQK